VERAAARPGLTGAVCRKSRVEAGLDTESVGSHRAYTSYKRYVFCKIDVPLR
jgi:hypothetical protein